MANEDFANDPKDAGEIGAGHHVTALYEIDPPRKKNGPAGNSTSSSRRRRGAERSAVKSACATRVRTTTEPVDRYLVMDKGVKYAGASDDLKFSGAVAGFGMLLRDSPHKGTLTYAAILELADPLTKNDRAGCCQEILGLVRKAQELTPAPGAGPAPPR